MDSTAGQFKDVLGASRFKLFVQVLLGLCDKNCLLDDEIFKNIKTTCNLEKEQIDELFGKMKPYLGEKYDVRLSEYKANRTSAIGFFSSMEGVSVLPLTFIQNILLPVIATTAFILLVPGVNMVGIGIAIAIATLWLVAGAMKYAQLIKGQEAERNLRKLVNVIMLSEVGPTSSECPESDDNSIDPVGMVSQPASPR